MAEQRQDDELEPTYNSSVPLQDVALKTYRKRWTIEKGGEKGSGISVLMVQHDDDDDCIRTTVHGDYISNPVEYKSNSSLEISQN